LHSGTPSTCNITIAKVVIINMSKNHIKCLAEGTNLLMFDGSIKSIENINETDLLMGVDSNPVNLVALSREFGQLYEIKPIKGISCIFGENHLLPLYFSKKHNKIRVGRYKFPHKTKKYNYGDFNDLNIEKLYQESNHVRHHAKIWKIGVEFHSQDTPIDPYILGLWLGDGHSKIAALTSMDQCIIDIWKEEGNKRGLKCSTYTQKNSKALTLRFSDPTVKDNRKLDNNQISEIKTKILLGIQSLSQISRDYNVGETLIGDIKAGKSFKSKHINDSDTRSLYIDLQKLNLISNKHIPQIYKINDRESRLQLLAGLIDSDGTRNKDSNYLSYSTKLYSLAEDVAFLSRSLGFNCNINSVRKTCINTGAVGNYYNVGISGSTEIIPMKLERKLCIASDTRKKNINGVKDIILRSGFYYKFNSRTNILLEDFTVI